MNRLPLAACVVALCGTALAIQTPAGSQPGSTDTSPASQRPADAMRDQRDRADKPARDMDKNRAMGADSVVLIPAEWAVGKNVLGANNEAIATINDLVIHMPPASAVSPAGAQPAADKAARHHAKVKYAVLSHGGVLGVGADRVLVPWKALRWDSVNRTISLPGLTKERLQQAPAYDENNLAEFSQPTFSTRINSFYSLGLDDDADQGRFAEEPGSRTDGQPAAPGLNDPNTTTNNNQNANPARRDDARADRPASAMAGGAYVRASKLDGLDINNSAGEKIADIDEIVLDCTSGKVAAAVLSFGGVMGVGESRVLVPLPAIRIDAEDRASAAGLDLAKLQSAPALKGSDWTVLSDRDEIRRIHAHYGQDAAWLANIGGSATNDPNRNNRNNSNDGNNRDAARPGQPAGPR